MTNRVGAAYGLGAAALFGLSAPAAKLLLADTGPLTLSALLYLGAGAALTGARAIRFESASSTREAKLRGPDYAILAVITMLGGIAGPLLMLAGLNRVSALSGSLLLNLEAVFTILIAISLFGEHLGRREAISAALIIVGAILISSQPGELRADPLGAVLIAAACLAWGIDNNLSQRLSLRDPIATVQIKTLGAGTAMLTVALVIGTPAPTAAVVIAALVVGALCYGLSLVFDMQALRHLGAAREAAYFATAPFIGALVSIPIFGNLPDFGAILAALLMASGVAILLRERHLHMHTHEVLEHDHLHAHDEHHQHHHDPPVVEPHSHPHRHQPMTHAHPHVSDLHHRHRHT